jgi:hypothetical protein
MNITNQGACQSRKTAKYYREKCPSGGISQPKVGAESQASLGTFATPGASNDQLIREGVGVMLGKLAGAWLGEKVAGENKGAKGAILGYGAASLAKRSIPTLAALVLGGWAFRKWRDRRRSNAAYPSDDSPSS